MPWGNFFLITLQVPRALGSRELGPWFVGGPEMIKAEASEVNPRKKPDEQMGGKKKVAYRK